MGYRVAESCTAQCSEQCLGVVRWSMWYFSHCQSEDKGACSYFTVRLTGRDVYIFYCPTVTEGVSRDLVKP
jgi:hypothetical protein